MQHAMTDRVQRKRKLGPMGTTMRRRRTEFSLELRMGRRRRHDARVMRLPQTAGQELHCCDLLSQRHADVPHGANEFLQTQGGNNLPCNNQDSERVGWTGIGCRTRGYPPVHSAT